MTFSSKCRALGLLLALLPGTAGAAGDRAFDLDGDGTADLALPAGLDPASYHSYPDDRDGDGTLELGGPAAPAAAAAPNPVAAFTRLTAGPTVARLAIHDASGRLVRRLDAAGGSAVWDARDEGAAPWRAASTGCGPRATGLRSRSSL